MIKYIIHEGYIISINDAEEHFISGERLIRLYKLKKSECGIIRYRDPRKNINFKGNHIHLYPRYDGNYNLNQEAPCQADQKSDLKEQ